MLTGNIASRNTASGFLLDESGANVLTANHAIRNGDNGFYVLGSGGNVLEGNVTERNSSHGVKLESRNSIFRAVGNLLQHNLAQRNSGYGFYVDLAIVTMDNNFDNEFEDNACTRNALGGDNRADMDC